ncbi:MBL fold metallo-hydrolase [Mesorhizobium sp. CA12]|uniref:MBL fold metallo-hydrolase n=1 Tax=Mesorhizobium sp. CA12 TaxID=2876644 RepID=UPI001CCF7301|nr:MBL fold metallo-hydrolase [Mesorhizobium sp. CA12]MBZ9859094.1 MBL fold metallo-hydrolase [Mesorhizobium sp. CA12]
MVLTHHRIQQPVGQGFFHTAMLVEDGSVFHYVFDCGSMSTYKAARNARIKAYRKTVAPSQVLDVLFISHAHADHLNGLEQLLAPGLGVDTIVMPLLDAVDRLLAFGRDLVEDAASAQNVFYRDFIVDPASALGRFNPRQILMIRPSHDGPGAPGSDGDGFGGPDGGRHIGIDPSQARLGWKAAGRGSVQIEDRKDQGGSDPLVALVDDTVAVAVPLKASKFWLLAPYVDPAVGVEQKRFKGALAAELRSSGAHALARKINSLSAGDVAQIVKKHTAALSAAYASIAKNLNVTSLCLYSGLAPQSSSLKGLYAWHSGHWQHSDAGAGERIGWLTTGDAALKERHRRKSFLEHFGKLLARVVTLTLPHHGSDHNFDRELLTATAAEMFVVAAARYGTWRHPGSHVVQEVASAGRFVSVVTSSESSVAWEWASVE